MDIQYIYLIQTREFVNSKEPIYKVGKTKQSNYSRFLQYPNGSIQLFQCVCNNCDILEKQVIKIFKNKYENHKIAGREYFRGELRLMICDLFNIIENEPSIIADVLNVNVNETVNIASKTNKKHCIEIEETDNKTNDNDNQCFEQSINSNGKYSCQTCQFSTKTRFCLNVHNNTKKHKTNTHQLPIVKKKYQCKTCNNGYNFASGLYCHIKKCRGIYRNTKTLESNFEIICELKRINDRINTITNDIIDKK